MLLCLRLPLFSATIFYALQHYNNSPQSFFSKRLSALFALIVIHPLPSLVPQACVSPQAPSIPSPQPSTTPSYPLVRNPPPSFLLHTSSHPHPPSSPRSQRRSGCKCRAGGGQHFRVRVERNTRMLMPQDEKWADKGWILQILNRFFVHSIPDEGMNPCVAMQKGLQIRGHRPSHMQRCSRWRA